MGRSEGTGGREVDFCREVRKVEEIMGRVRRAEIQAFVEGERVRIM